MKYLKNFSALLIIIILTGCDKNGNGSIYREFFENSALEITQENDYGPGLLLVEGSGLVFRFTFQHPDEEFIADDELSEIFWFQVPQGQTSFSYQAEESTSADVNTLVYQRSCFCGPVDYQFLSYSIEGTQVNQNEWRIKFSMLARDDFGTEYPLSDEGVYALTVN